MTTQDLQQFAETLLSLFNQGMITAEQMGEALVAAAKRVRG